MPCSIILPCSMTKMVVAFCMVDKRCATIKLVLPSMMFWNAACTFNSVLVSMLLVASSKISIGWIDRHHPCNTKQLFLPLRKVAAVFCYDGIVTVWHLHNKAVCKCCLCRRNHFFVCCIGLAAREYYVSRMVPWYQPASVSTNATESSSQICPLSWRLWEYRQWKSFLNSAS